MSKLSEIKFCYLNEDHIKYSLFFHNYTIKSLKFHMQPVVLFHNYITAVIEYSTIVPNIYVDVNII